MKASLVGSQVSQSVVCRFSSEVASFVGTQERWISLKDDSEILESLFDS